jgi:hypothetical protein
MAHEVNAKGALVKVRNPVGPILLTIVTLGIYGIVWYYKINREMRDFGAAMGDDELKRSNPTNSVLAITIGALVIVPPIISYIGTVNRIQRVQKHAGVDPIPWSLIAPLWIIGYLVGVTLLAIPYLLQDGLNKVWTKYPAVSEGGHVALPEAGQPPAPASEQPVEQPSAGA